MLKISNSWDKIIPLCPCHAGQRVVMTIQNGPSSLFYACPKYYPGNRTKEENACFNRINLIEYEKMVNKLMDQIARAELEMGSVYLTGFTWKEKGILYRVVSHEGDRIEVEIKNTKTCN